MTWFEHDDSRIYFEEYGDGESLLLLPGFSQSGDDLLALRNALAASYHVIAVDLPGSGRSQPQPRIYTANYYEDDAVSFAALLRKLGAGPTHLIGFSDGGEVALFMAALTPDLARSLVTWGAAGQLSDPDGSLRQVMYNLVDHPIPPLQGYRDFLVGRYGEANARTMTQNSCGGHKRHHRRREAGPACHRDGGQHHLPCAAYHRRARYVRATTARPAVSGAHSRMPRYISWKARAMTCRTRTPTGWRARFSTG